MTYEMSRKEAKARARAAYRAHWKKRSSSSSTPGSSKTSDTCRATSLDKFMAKASRARRHPDYQTWLEVEYQSSQPAEETMTPTITDNAIRHAESSLPAGTWGFAVVPWAPTKLYAVAADWENPNAPIWAWMPDANEWRPYSSWTVADFDGSPYRALADIVEEVLARYGISSEDVFYLARDAAEKAGFIGTPPE